MGKKSLIKSTSKKKSRCTESGPGKENSRREKTRRQESRWKKGYKEEGRAQEKSCSEEKSRAKEKNCAEKGCTPKSRCHANSFKNSRRRESTRQSKKGPGQKLTLTELLHLKFDWPQSGKVVKATRAATTFSEPPPLIDVTDKAEIKRIKSVLMRAFDMQAIRAAGRKAAEEKAVAEKAAAAKAAAEKVKVSYDAPAAPPQPPVDRTGQYLTFGAVGVAVCFFCW